MPFSCFMLASLDPLSMSFSSFMFPLLASLDPLFMPFSMLASLDPLFMPFSSFMFTLLASLDPLFMSFSCFMSVLLASLDPLSMSFSSPPSSRSCVCELTALLFNWDDDWPRLLLDRESLLLDSIPCSLAEVCCEFWLSPSPPGKTALLFNWDDDWP